MIVEISSAPEVSGFFYWKNGDLIIYAVETILIEVPIFFLCGYRRAKDLILFAAVNLISNLLLNDFLSNVDSQWLTICVGEIFVLALEFALCSYWIGGSRLKLLKTLTLTNAVSFFSGVLFFWLN